MIRHLTIPEQHQLKIAKQTMKLSEVGAMILGGMSHATAKTIIKRLEGERNDKREKR